MNKYLVRYTTHSGEFDFGDYFVVEAINEGSAQRKARRIADKENKADEPWLIHDSFQEQMEIEDIRPISKCEYELIDNFIHLPVMS